MLIMLINMSKTHCSENRIGLDLLNPEPAKYPVRLQLEIYYVQKSVLNWLNWPKIGNLAKPDRFYRLALFFFFLRSAKLFFYHQ